MLCIDIKYLGIGFCRNDARSAFVWIGQSIFGGFTTIMLSHQFARDCIACLTGRELMAAGVQETLHPGATSAMIRLTFLLINFLC